MEFSFNINFLTRCASLEKAASALSKAGFKYLDYSAEVGCDDWKSKYEKALEIFKNEGLKVYQSHSPMFRYTNKPPVVEQIERCFEATVSSGAKYMVVHADEFDFENLEYSPERAFEYNHNLFAPFVKKAEKAGIKIAFETVFADYFHVHRGRPRFTSDINDLKNLIESFGSPAACCCWDFGHAGVQFKEKHAQNIRYMGSLIECTHMHDCNFDLDTHLPPFLGEIDWKECITAFKETGFDGVVNVEFAHGHIPENLLDTFMKYVYDTAVEVMSL